MIDTVEGEEFRKLEDRFERLCEVLGIDPNSLQAMSRVENGLWIIKDRTSVHTLRSLAREALIGPDPNS